MKGVDYFPLDVHMNDAVELIEAEFGLTGFAVLIKIFQKIYGGEGYYCNWNEDIILLLQRQLNCENVKEIIERCIERGIFDKKMYSKHQILTSAGIQKRFFDITARRKKIIINEEFLLNSKIVDRNDKNVCKNEKNAYKNQQSKVKESKVKESKESIKATAFQPPSLDEVKRYIIDNSYNVNADRFFEFYSSKGWLIGKNRMKDWKAAVRGWHAREKNSGNFNDYSLKTSYDYAAIEAKALNFGKE